MLLYFISIEYITYLCIKISLKSRGNLFTAYPIHYTLLDNEIHHILIFLLSAVLLT